MKRQKHYVEWLRKLTAVAFIFVKCEFSPLNVLFQSNYWYHREMNISAGIVKSLKTQVVQPVRMAFLTCKIEFKIDKNAFLSKENFPISIKTLLWC